MIGLEYGSTETSAEFVTWVLHRFPPPDEVTVQFFEWGPGPELPRRRPSRTCSPSDADMIHHHITRVVGLFPSPLMDDAAPALIRGPASSRRQRR
jgi:hypothetical protein